MSSVLKQESLKRTNQNITINKPVSQSCAVAESEKFWRATGQSNLADRTEDCSTGQSAVVWVRKPVRKLWKLLLCGQQVNYTLLCMKLAFLCQYHFKINHKRSWTCALLVVHTCCHYSTFHVPVHHLCHLFLVHQVVHARPKCKEKHFTTNTL